MESLEVLRDKLDKIDDQIAALYEERMKVCGQVGEYKVKTGRKVFDRQREKEKLADVASKVSGDFNKKGIQELYQQLMSMSRKLQYRQLVEAGALENCRSSGSTILTGRMQESFSRELKARTVRLLCISFLETV